MNKIIRGTTRLMLSKQASLFSSTLIVAGTIGLSRIFGFMRYRVLAGYFPKEMLDVYFAAFRIPDMVFEILITGALASAFIPIYIKYQKDKKELSYEMSAIISLVSAVMAISIIILAVLAPVIMPLITPGFSPDKLQKVILYSQILLIGQLPFLVASNILTSIGQAQKTFIITSFAPVAYNVAIIIVTIMGASSWGLMAPIVGVVIGAVVMFIMQIPLVKSAEFAFQIILKITNGVREFTHIMMPRLVTVLVAQIDATVDLALASFLGSGSYTIFYLAQHLQLLPVSIIGIAFGQASLPYLSELYRERKIKEFAHLITESIVSVLLVTIPIASFFIFARTPLVRLFFGGEKFDWDATVLTAQTLSFFALGIPAHAVYYFLTRCYYAVFDTKTPFFVSLISIVTNIAISVMGVFVFHLGVWSLALAFSTSMILNVFILLVLLSQKQLNIELGLFTRQVIKILTATIIASFFVYLGMKLVDGLILDTQRSINVFLLLAGGGTTYVAIYAYITWLLGVESITEVVKVVDRVKRYRQRIVEIYSNFNS